MRLNKAGGKYQKKSSLLLQWGQFGPAAARAVFAAAGAALIFAAAPLGAAWADSGHRGLRAAPPAGYVPLPQNEAPVREADLLAFCPPAEFADSAYAYRIYSGSALKLQAAIADITRDCRYDEGKGGFIHLHIAAAGRAVPAQAAARGAVSLPIEVKITNGDKILFSKVYAQKIALTGGTAQFLFSQWVELKKADVPRGTKISIGFGRSGPGKAEGSSLKIPRDDNVPYLTPDEWAQARENAGRPQPPKPPRRAGAEQQTRQAKPKPKKPDLLSPKGGALSIPEQP